MALFAKKLEYYGSKVGYLALLAIAKKKGGKSISYIIYIYNSSSGWTMRSFFTLTEAQNATHFVGSRTLSPTTEWLHRVASSGDYKEIPIGVWARVPVPCIGGRKRKKKQMQVGDLGVLYRLAESEKRNAQKRLQDLDLEIEKFDNQEEEYRALPRTYAARKKLTAAKDVVLAELALARLSVLNLRSEMEFARSRRTGIPLTSPKWNSLKKGLKY